jgi:hypothetical protein
MYNFEANLAVAMMDSLFASSPQINSPYKPEFNGWDSAQEMPVYRQFIQRNALTENRQYQKTGPITTHQTPIQRYRYPSNENANRRIEVPHVSPIKVAYRVIK